MISCFQLITISITYHQNYQILVFIYARPKIINKILDLMFQFYAYLPVFCEKAMEINIYQKT